MSSKAVVTFNTGSSSLKFALFPILGDAVGAPQVRGNISGLNTASPRLDLAAGGDALEAHARALIDAVPDKTPAHLIQVLARCLDEKAGGHQIACTAHRIVHGGLRHAGPAWASPDVLDALEPLSVFAPSHQPHNLAGVRALAAIWPDRPQSLSFDTAFHRTQPAIAAEFALPRDLTDNGLIRYGFHGLSYHHIGDVLPEALAGRAHRRTVVAHLGSGASLCALLDGRSVATSMGLTALDGLPMSTRCGDLDPGLVLHLIADRGMDARAVASRLYSESGLLGVSGISGDVRDLIASREPMARHALDLFAYRIRREIASLAAALEGLDALIFTAGIGENSPDVRADVCRDLGWLGVTLDTAANTRNAPVISVEGTSVTVAIIPADEEVVLAQDALALMQRMGR